MVNATKYHFGIKIKGVGSPKLPRKGKCSVYQLQKGKRGLPKNNERHTLLEKSSTMIPKKINFTNVKGYL